MAGTVVECKGLVADVNAVNAIGKGTTTSRMAAGAETSAIAYMIVLDVEVRISRLGLRRCCELQTSGIGLQRLILTTIPTEVLVSIVASYHCRLERLLLLL